MVIKGYTIWNESDIEPSFVSETEGFQFTSDNQLLSIPVTAPYFFGEQFTIQIWVKPTNFDNISFDVLLKATRDLNQLYALRVNSD